MKEQQEDIRQMKSRINNLEAANRILMQEQSERAER